MKRAIIVYGRERESAHFNAARILDFFGVPWSAASVEELLSSGASFNDAALIGPVDALAAVLMPNGRQDGSDQMPPAMFAFVGKERVQCEQAFRWFSGGLDASIVECPAGDHRFSISREAVSTSGPMSGIEFLGRTEGRAYILNCTGVVGNKWSNIISVDGSPAFIRFAFGRTSTYFLSSSDITNIDEFVEKGYYDIKEHFLAAVPFVMFVKEVFRETAWREQELGACLIVDDPLLRSRYGRCDFRVLRELMQQEGFTTNISFIPWNWRRTSQTAAAFFRETKPFSVSIHGCDHTSSEFGDSSRTNIQSKALLAQQRMEFHEGRTGIHHDRIMVFPQGVFSSVCPGVLKRSGYTAAVNTEILPVDIGTESTRICDVWNVAITRYDDFPIFTRRYDRHGIENFAYDLLIGKPCLIVSHHEFFRDKCHAALELVEKLRGLSCTLQWQSLGDVVRKACRLRNAVGGFEVEMPGTELYFRNPLNEGADVVVRKAERGADAVLDVQCNSKTAQYELQAGQITIRDRLEPGGEMQLKIHYKPVQAKTATRPLSFEMSVAFRRILSEVRDQYLA